MPTADRVGFLPISRSLEFDGGSLSVLPEFDEARSAIAFETNPDGYVYPPVQRMVKRRMGDLESSGVELPGSMRAALLWHLGASHEISLEVLQSRDEFRSRDGAFVMYAVAYLYGYRLQFDEWWFDGRIPMKRSTHHVLPVRDAESRFLSAAYRTWFQWQAAEQRRFTNLLYMHSRAPSYEWDWEQFLSEYMVTDALFRQNDNLQRLKGSPTHGQRIKAMCDLHGVWFHDALVAELVALRSELFHEGLWEGGSPGHAFSDRTFDRTHQLRCLNQRLIAATLGFHGPYVSGAWADWRMLQRFE
jgi:hypothetical protein